MEPRVRADIAGIALLMLATLTAVALLYPEGILLVWWRQSIVATLGWGAFVVALLFGMFGLGFWFEAARPRRSLASAGIVLGFVTGLGILQAFVGGSPEDGTAAGGHVGQGTVALFATVLGELGARVALVALFAATVLIVANRPLSVLLRPRLSLRRGPDLRALVRRTADAMAEGELEGDGVRINAPRPLRPRVVDAAPKRDESDPEATHPMDAPSRAALAEPPRQQRLRLVGEEAETQARVPVTPSAREGRGVLGAFGRDWTLPPIALLDEGSAARHGQDEIRHNIRVIEETLAHFAIAAKVVEVNVGPVVTRYELKPAAGVKLSRIEALQDDLALALAARSLRIEAPVPGKSVVGIEIPNLAIGLVSVRDVVASALFKAAGSKLAVALGRDLAGGPVLADLTKLPHLLIAGQTGSGKSVCINALITSLLMNATPEEVRLVLIDPKRVELTAFNGVPQLLVPVITDHDKILTALRWATGEMDRRYRLFAQAGARNIDRYNEARTGAERIPYVVIVVDELADLMILAPIDVEEAITRIAQLARATGIHLVIATQRPSVEVITGLIKANIPARIAFAMASSIDSRTILDMTGAEKLLGRGDMLYLAPDQAKPIRAQGVYVSDKEIDRVTDHWRRQGQPDYHLSVLEAPVKARGAPDDGEEIGDALFADAVRVVTQFERASASLLQRRLKIGYARAARLMDLLEERGVVGPGEGAKPREVLITDARAYLGDGGEDD